MDDTTLTPSAPARADVLPADTIRTKRARKPRKASPTIIAAPAPAPEAAAKPARRSRPPRKQAPRKQAPRSERATLTTEEIAARIKSSLPAPITPTHEQMLLGLLAQINDMQRTIVAALAAAR